jgi:hypothetical protein
MPKPGERRIVRDISYEEWIGGRNAEKFATREQVVAFWNLALQEQVIPLIQLYLARYDRERRLHRRAWRAWNRAWNRLRQTVAHLAARLLRKPPGDESADDAAQGEEPASTAAAARELPSPRLPTKTCVVCGTSQLEPIDVRGGLRCANGHIVEDPPVADRSEL